MYHCIHRCQPTFYLSPAGLSVCEADGTLSIQYNQIIVMDTFDESTL